MPAIISPRILALRNWAAVVAALVFFKLARPALAQNDPTVGAAQTAPTVGAAQDGSTTNAQDSSAAKTTLQRQPWDLRWGPFDLHPRFVAGMIYDDNILLAEANKEADAEWLIQPAVQAIAGDDASLIAYRDQNYDVLTLAPGNIIVQPDEVWPGKLLILDYGPRFQIFDRYTANNSIDEFGTLNLLLPMSKLILGFRQDYSYQKTELIEFNQRATIEVIGTSLSAAYQFGDKSSMESDFRRITTGYGEPGLIGYTEYNTEDWFNYAVAENLPVSLGVLAGIDDVGGQQNQSYEQLRVRARYSRTEKLSFDASFGGELRQYQNGTPQTLYPVFSVSGLYRPTERTSLTLTGLRAQYASIFDGYNYATTGAALALQQDITDRFTVGLSMGYYALDFTPTQRGLVKYTGDYYTPRISFSAKIVRHLDGLVYYQFLNSYSQLYYAIDDQFGAQLTLHF